MPKQICQDPTYTIENKTKQNKTKQNKTKQNKKQKTKIKMPQEQHIAHEAIKI
jgi:hypothetical protein